MSGQHAEYAPSSMYLTVNCPGWKKQAEGLPPEEPTEASREGEAGHWVAAIAASVPAGQWPRVDNAAENAKAPDGTDVTEEMIDGAATWVAALEGYPARIETPVQIARLHPTKCWGTPDARQWNPAPRIVRVADYKFGHDFVDEWENWQLLAYAVGIADELGVFDDPGITYEMTVVQPRFYNAEPVRTWTIMGAGLAHYAERMRHAINEAESASPRVISGTHCTYCPARVNCKTFAKSVMHSVDFAGRPDPMLRTPEQIGAELALVREAIKRLEARETGLSAVAESLIRGGQAVPYFHLEPTVGRLQWTVPNEVVEMSAQMVGKSVVKPMQIITPTQAKDRKILDTRVIAAYSDRPPGAMKLVRDTPKQARKFSA